MDWIAAARSFPAIVEAEGLTTGVAVSSIPTPAWADLFVSGMGVALGAAAVWIAFAYTQDRYVRLIGLVAGCLLASTYAREYDLVALRAFADGRDCALVQVGSGPIAVADGSPSQSMAGGRL